MLRVGGGGGRGGRGGGGHFLVRNFGICLRCRV